MSPPPESDPSRTTIAQALVDAAAALTRAGLVTAFGHVSARYGAGAVITPGIPLSRVRSVEDVLELDLGDRAEHRGLPGEAWIHWSIYRSRPDVGGICRAQPPAVDAASAVGCTLVPRHGQGSFLGPEVPVLDDARLVRERQAGISLAATLADAPCLVMRGNGAVTVGTGLGDAVARMYVLERSAQLNIAAASSASATRLSAPEYAAWRKAEPELLGRIWAYLRAVGRGD